MPLDRSDRAQLNGVGRALKRAFPPDPPIDPSFEAAAMAANGNYRPDEAADERASQLLDRLKRLPWGDDRRPPDPAK